MTKRRKKKFKLVKEVRALARKNTPSIPVKRVIPNKKRVTEAMVWTDWDRQF